jgi:hypothetical protein
LRVRVTNHLFAPGRFAFDTTASAPIEVTRLASVSAGEANAATTHELAQRVRALYDLPVAPSQA